MIKRFLLRLWILIFCMHDEWEQTENDKFEFIFGKNTWKCTQCGKKIRLMAGDKPVGCKESDDGKEAR